MKIRDERQSRKADMDFDLLWREGVKDGGPLILIEPHLISFDTNVRQTFNEADMADLRASIAQLREIGVGTIEGTGFLQPIMVRLDESAPLGSPRYKGIFGERRWRAANELEQNRKQMDAKGTTDYYFPTPFLIPAWDAGQLSDATIEQIQLHENEHSVGLSPAESGRKYLQQFRDGKTVDQIAHDAGKTRRYIENRIIIAKAPADVQAMAEARPDCLSLVLELVELPDQALRRPFIKAALEKGYDNNFTHGIRKLTEDARDAKNEYRRKKAQEEREEKARREKAERAAAKLAAKAANSAPAILGSIGTGGITSRGYTTPLPDSESVPDVPPIAAVPVAYQPPLERPNRKKRERFLSEMSGIEKTQALTSGRAQSANILSAELVHLSVEGPPLDNIEREETKEMAERAIKHIVNMRRTLDNTERSLKSVLYNLDIEYQDEQAA